MSSSYLGFYIFTVPAIYVCLYVFRSVFFITRTHARTHARTRTNKHTHTRTHNANDKTSIATNVSILWSIDHNVLLMRLGINPQPVLDKTRQQRPLATVPPLPVTRPLKLTAPNSTESIPSRQCFPYNCFMKTTPTCIDKPGKT